MNENLVKVRIGGKIVSRRLYSKVSDGSAISGKIRTGWGKMSPVSKIGRQKVFQIIAS